MLHVVRCMLHVACRRCPWLQAVRGALQVAAREEQRVSAPVEAQAAPMLHHGSYSVAPRLYPVATHGPKEGLCAAHERVAKVFYLGAKLLELFIIGRSRQDRRLCEPTGRRRCNAARCNALQHSATCCNPTPAPACASRTTAVATSERAREVHRERVRGASHAPESAGLLRRQLRRGDAELQERRLRLGLFRLHLRVPRRRLECLRPEATRLEHAMATAAEQPPAVH